MEILTVNEVAKATGGILLSGDGTTEINSVCIDSRAAGRGTLFVPIIGERVDAHKFIDQVFKSGAAAVLTSRNEVVVPDKAHINVADTQKAIGALAAYYRMKFSLPVIGITGSVGKTSTKEMIAAALSSKLNVLKTSGNQNSKIGVPLTLFRIESQHQIAVIEMGISEFGEMDALVEMVKPDTAVVTNIGVAHIAQLKTQENIMAQKLLISKEFKESNRLYLNGDDPLLAKEAANIDKRTSLFGQSQSCEFFGSDIHIQDGKQVFTFNYSVNRETVTINQLGLHNVNNAVVALAIAMEYGISPAQAKLGLASYEGIAMRQQINHLRDGIKVIDDTYNASPDSIISGTGVLEAIDNSGRKVAVLADVLELGEVSQKCHYDTGCLLAEKNIEEIITVGQEMKALVAGVKENNPKIVTCNFDNNSQAIAYLENTIRPGDALLIKGSRGMHMEEVTEALKARFNP